MAVVTKENFKEIGAAYIARHGEGHVLTSFDASARLWMAYYRSKGLSTAFMEQQLRAGKEYTVPCQRPADFDPETRISMAAMPRPERLASEMELAEREAIVRRAVAGTKATTRIHHGRYAQEDVRVEDRPMPTARPLTDAERASMARLLGETSYREAAE